MAPSFDFRSTGAPGGQRSNGQEAHECRKPWTPECRRKLLTVAAGAAVAASGVRTGESEAARSHEIVEVFVQDAV
jgi:hypothetical protein